MSISGEESDEDYFCSDADFYYKEDTSYSSDEDSVNHEEENNYTYDECSDENIFMRNNICPISYIVLKNYHSKCKTCKYCFDCDAIAYWFIKSNNKVCPMCRSLWK